MKYHLISACISDRGNIREHNEDNLYFDGKFFPEEHTGLKKAVVMGRDTETICCFAVFDGMGGACCGETASYIAASEFHEKFQELEHIMKPPKQFLREACFKMNEKICEEAVIKKAQGMGTTAAILYFHMNQVYVCNLGDSPIFRMRNGCLETIYEEHTNRKFLEEQGLTEKKPLLTQCLGIPPEEMTIQPYIAKGEIRPGDQYLVCSDGLTDGLSGEMIAEILKRPAGADVCVQELLACSLAQGTRDNVTVILCRVAI